MLKSIHLALPPLKTIKEDIYAIITSQNINTTLLDKNQVLLDQSKNDIESIFELLEYILYNFNDLKANQLEQQDQQRTITTKVDLLEEKQPETIKHTSAHKEINNDTDGHKKSEIGNGIPNESDKTDLKYDVNFDKNLNKTIEKLSEERLLTFIKGETGVGKGHFVDQIRSKCDKDMPFQQVNCATLEKSLADGELFGHKKGAHSGAHDDRKGIILETDKGLLFLDEIGALTQAVQQKLLTFLENGLVRPVGSDKTIPSSVWIIAATTNPENILKPLYARFSEKITIPPLRHRTESFFTLAKNIFKTEIEDLKNDGYNVNSKRFPNKEVNNLISQKYKWAMNIRQLKFAIRNGIKNHTGRDLKAEVILQEAEKYISDET